MAQGALHNPHLLIKFVSTPCSRKGLQPSPTDQRVRIYGTDKYPSNARGDDRIGAGTRLAT